MLFYLTDTLIIERTSPQFANIRKAVRYIAMAVLESKHLLRGDYDVLKFMAREFVSDEEIFPVFHQLVTRYSTYTVPDDICRYVEVVLDGYDNYEKDGHKVKQMPYTFFDDSMKVQAMTVVGEDEDDCALFGYILKYYMNTRHLHYNCYYTTQGGGGSRTDVAVRSNLKAGKMVTCITDSDQRFEGQALDPRSCGVKCGKIKAMDKIYYFLRLPVLEVENLIPLNHFNELDWSHEANRKDKEAFDLLCYNAHSEKILPYFDMKEGIKKEYILQFGDGMEKYAAMCCYCNPEVMGGKSFQEYVAGLKPEDWVYPRLRKRPMGELAPKYRKGELPEPELMEFQIEAWSEIAALLLDATCARFKEAITV